MTKSILNHTRTEFDFDRPQYYNNRELSWLAFNERVLQEAINPQNPLLERCKFLAIFSSNLDEFYMVRVAGLKDQVDAGYNKPENKAGMTPKQQLKVISETAHQLVTTQTLSYTEQIVPALKKEGLWLATIQDLDAKQVSYLETYFDDYLLPILTPMAIDAYHPFPKLANKKLNLFVMLIKRQGDSKEKLMAIVQVPSGVNRAIEVPSRTHERIFVLLEDVLSLFIHKLFVGYKVYSVSPFRITRNADLDLHEEGARDLLKEIEKELKKRRWGAAVRLEYSHSSMDNHVLKYLIKVLELHSNDTFAIKGPLDLTFLTTFYSEIKDDYDHLVYETFIPQPPQDLIGEEDIFEAVREKDILLHHPYESFQPVIDLIAKAAEDPDVLAIKQTLYRVSGDSPIIQALERAAENGKQVTVLVELKARFDEEKNIHWAKKLEKTGVHVIYGLTALKTHSKITLIVRKNKDKIQRIVHMGTGNYNDQTAKVYTDVGFVTMNELFAIDATHFFNYLSGYTERPNWNRISISPYQLRDTFIQLIEQEIKFHKQAGNGRIIAKMNAITDKRLIVKLYEASCEGVSIDLIVRGICCLRPGIPGVSENIRVRSIVGRFLEHSRIYYFHHGGEEKLFLSSADWMTRNMEKRVEICFPIEKTYIKQRLMDILDLMLRDNVKARIQDAKGIYHFVVPTEEEERIDSQNQLLQLAYQAVVEDDE